MKDRKKYLHLGLMLFFTACAILVFYDTFYKGGTLQRFMTKLVDIIAPVLYGFVMAYLLAPIVNWMERVLTGGANRALKGKGLTVPNRWLRALSIFLTWAFALLLIYLLLVMLIPQLVESITMLIANAEGYYRQIYAWVNGVLNGESDVGSWASDMIDRYYDNALDILEKNILPWAQTMLTSLTGGIWSGILGVVMFLKNFIIGIIVSVYMLAMKERSAARCAKLVYGVFREDRAKLIMRGTRKVDKIFSGFVRGKLLDSLIIGILCFIGCSILGLPYTPLVSVIVGVTNVIPFFGPFLGAVPSAFLILLVSPLKCLYFIIFIIILQQLDGNVIGPRILGGSTGISSLWVVIAILVGGGFGGMLGMFVGVPICASLQALTRYLVDQRLRKRGMPVEAYAYVHRDQEEPDGKTAEEKPKAKTS
ncbi:MAG: AI-2E family transporter [Oscillospiraceae bacterium]|nr:AI-2E family transporter [Oscillospiraceae bacterium]